MTIDLKAAMTDRDTLKEMIKHDLDLNAFTALSEMRTEIANDLLMIDELSKDTLGSYVSKASADASHEARHSERRRASADASMKRANDPKLAFASSGNKALAKHDMKKADAHDKKSIRRELGITKAVSRLTK